MLGLPTTDFTVSRYRWAVETAALQSRHNPLMRCLQELQGGTCYWCRGRLRNADSITREHVIRRSSPAYQNLDPHLKWYAIRLAHYDCNRRYARWCRQNPARAAHQDGFLAKVVTSMVRPGTIESL